MRNITGMIDIQSILAALGVAGLKIAQINFIPQNLNDLSVQVVIAVGVSALILNSIKILEKIKSRKDEKNTTANS